MFGHFTTLCMKGISWIASSESQQVEKIEQKQLLKRISSNVNAFLIPFWNTLFIIFSKTLMKNLIERKLRMRRGYSEHFMYNTLFVFRFFHVALSSCCTLSMLDFCHIAFFSCFAISFTFHVFFVLHFFSFCTFFALQSFNVSFFLSLSMFSSYFTFFYSFRFVFMFHFFRVAHFSCELSCCILFMSHFSRVALFSCFAISMLHFFQVSLFSYCNRFMLHYFHAVFFCVTLFMLFSCCTFFVSHS